MNQEKLKKCCVIVLAAYLLLAAAFYWICGDQLHYREQQTDMLTASSVIGEITAEDDLWQQITVEDGELLGLTLYGATYDRANTGVLNVEVYNGQTRIAFQSVDVSTLEDNSRFYVSFAEPVSVPDKVLQLHITAPESALGNAVTLYTGNTMSAARAQVSAGLREDELAQLNGAALDGALCLQIHTRQDLAFGDYYWYFAGAAFAVLCAYSVVLLQKNKAGKPSVVTSMLDAFSRYQYLIKQLVSRDFKTKYKRSVLGVLWSFLNPLLTMSVQYVIFSALFRSDIPNFAVYLLTGIVCFSFFSESTSMALTSIVGNAPLITKVYVPKYIYPLTRVISSVINFLLALIPLFAVLLITRIPIRPAIFLVPIGVVCLFAVNLGIGLFLSSAMVFFRDTQFLWGVLSMLWMYATPIFYPESIIPASIMPVYKCNPLYHIIRFLRIVLMDGISPEPRAYALMLVVSFVPLVIGALVFKKTQDRFILHI